MSSLLYEHTHESEANASRTQMELENLQQTNSHTEIKFTISTMGVRIQHRLVFLIY